MMGEPAYVLIVHSSDPTCGRGDNYNVEVYISGVGDVELAKLYVSIPPYIPDTIKIDPDGRRLTVKTKTFRYTEIVSPNFFKEKLDKNDLHPNVFDLTIPHYFFNRKFYNNDPNDLGVEGERITWDKQWWLDDYYHAPISFSFTVANDAPSGDHNIYLHLVYKDCLRWYSNCATLKIHIKQWYEEDCIRILVVLATIASIISGCFALSNLISPK